MGLAIGTGGAPRLARLSFAVGDIGKAVSRFMFVGLFSGTRGALGDTLGPSLLCGRLSRIDLSSSESSPGLKGWSIRRGVGGGNGRAIHCQSLLHGAQVADIPSEGDAGGLGTVLLLEGGSGAPLGSRRGGGGTARSA